MESITFDGDVVVVTGGGRGLGRAYCLELARRGASVVVNDVVGEHADAVVAEIEAAGGTAVATHDSIATAGGGAAVVERAVEAFGTVDAVVNNARILRNNPFEDLTVEEIDAVLDVNLRGTFFVTQPAWRLMKAKGYGRVVLTSSAAGLFSRPGSVNYSASKAAAYGICRALSFEGAEHGIKANALLPRAATTIADANPIPASAAAAYVPAAENDEPRRRPDVTAPLVCYLASRACAVSGEAFSSALGNYGRVFVGRAHGWTAPAPLAITVEDVAAHLDEIRALEGHSVPLSNADEIDAVARLLPAE